MFERCCLDIFNWNWIISKLCYFNIKSRYLKIMLFKHSEQIFPENMLFTWVKPDISRQKHVFEWYFGDILQYILKNINNIFLSYLGTNINKLERIQRQPVRFITGEYKSREVGCVSNTLTKLKLQDIQTRRSSQKLIFLYEVVAVL